MRMLILLGFLSAVVVASTHSSPQNTYGVIDDFHSDIETVSIEQQQPIAPPLSAIHVLPPSPDDTPEECDASKKLHDSCGPERYCSELPSHSDNNTNTTTTYYCLHKALWFPSLGARDMLAFLLTGTCCFLAAMGGIGGGGLILPILLLCCNFTPKEASVLSNTAVFCNTAGQFCVNNWNRRGNSDSKTSLIYATVLMIMPGLIAGGSMAITLEGMVPSTAILILALLTLLLASTKTYKKAQKMRAAELEMALATPEPSTAISRTASRDNLYLEEEQQQDEALMTSALEFGELTNTKESSPLLASNNSNIMEEPFLGSIGYLNREDNEDNCVDIIDESSLTASLEVGSSTRAANNCEQADEGSQAGQGLYLWLCQHKLQLLIFGCWVLDATTFVLLHTGTLIRKCSLGFFILVGLPAVVAVIFVWLGRRHLLGARRRANNAGGEMEDEWQPLINTSYFQPFEGASDEEAYEPVPNLETIEPGSQSRASPPRQRDWVLLVPLVSAFAGIVRAFQLRRANDRASHRQELQIIDQGQDLSAPLIDRQPAGVGCSPSLINRSVLTSNNVIDQPGNDDESPVHDDYESLLAGWLPWASVLIGLLSALLGIGGGELLGPILLLLLRMDPQQSSATTAIMSMMNSGTNLLHYMVADMMKAPGYAVNLGLAGLLGGSGGRLQAMSMADSGRTSIIAMSLFIVLSLATGLVAWELATTPMSWKSNGGVC